MCARTPDADAIQSIQWQEDKVVMLDQTRLPGETTFLDIETAEAIHEAIRNLRIRGAPAIGIAAAYGLYLGIRPVEASSFDEFWEHVKSTADYLASARPTAVNLNWSLQLLMDGIKQRREKPIPEIKTWVLQRARQLHAEDKQICQKIGLNGVPLVPENSNILTHCNTGSLATGQFGTALSVIYHAHAKHMNPHVWVDETRPLLQGARLTTWELMRENIPCTLITDSTTGSLMRNGKVDLIIVGTDRVASNGDVANKIGTYPLALMAHEHKIPFYVAAPLSSIDLNKASGDEIPIEERGGEEITHIQGRQIAPDNVDTYSPAFDITPHRYISGFITESGIVRDDFEATFRKLKDRKASVVKLPEH